MQVLNYVNVNHEGSDGGDGHVYCHVVDDVFFRG